jgi:hypothetical protein
MDLRISGEAKKKAAVVAAVYGITLAQLFERLIEDTDEVLSFIS